MSTNSNDSGGALERPAEKFKSLLGHVQFFHDYPYALPGFVTSAIGLSAAILTLIFVREVCFPLFSLVFNRALTESRLCICPTARGRPARPPCPRGSS